MLRCEWKHRKYQCFWRWLKKHCKLQCFWPPDPQKPWYLQWFLLLTAQKHCKITAISPFFHVFRYFLNCVGPLYMAIKFFAFFFPTISTFGCFWSQWPTSLAVTSGREGVRTTSFKPWRPHRGSCRGATAIEENNGSRRERCGAGGCRREATWIP